MARAPSKTRSVVLNNGVAAKAVAGPALNVDYIRPELAKMSYKYTLIDDAIAGSEVIKAKGETYLPMPNAYDKSAENVERYAAYKIRAVFYNVSERTLAGMVGEVYKVAPEIKVPASLDMLVKDANGNGVPLVQQSKECHEQVTSKGRAGLLVDYPATTGEVTRQQQMDGSIKPTINLYRATDIINWRTQLVGNRILLTLVVLKENYELDDDGFRAEVAVQYRVLRLVDGHYVQEVWRSPGGAAFAPVPNLTVEPTDHTGNRLKEIPFTFVGSVNNSASIDPAPMFALCDLNIAHYRNSADYEESVFVTGQATPVLSGLDKRWVDDVLKGTVNLGSRGAIPLPIGASAELLQMEERSAAFEAMEHKEKQMVALGAKLVEAKTVQRTATESRQDEATESSILTTITNNVSGAYQWCLEWAAIFQGGLTVAEDANTADDSKKAILFKLNTDFDIMSISPEEVGRTIEAWQQDAISFTEMRTKLKQAKLAYQDDKVATDEIRKHRMDDGNFDRDNKLGDFAHDDDDAENAGA